MGVSVKADATNFAEATHGAATAIRILVMIASNEGHRASRKAQLTRKLQEQRLQANMKCRETKSISKQIEIQKKRLEINDKEMAIQQHEVESAVETDKWYQSKYTNEKLYAWMEKMVRRMHYNL